MTAILMAPHTMPSRFSLAEDVDGIPPRHEGWLSALADTLFAAVRRAYRALSAPHGRRRDSSAAAW